MDEFLAVCEALKTIRDQRLYRGGYASFDDYCRIRWRVAGKFVEQLIAEADL
jgi:hypothetical protein